MASTKELQKQLEQLQKENEALKEKAALAAKSVTMKVSEKGCLSVYNVGRNTSRRLPISLYYDEWLCLLEDQREAILKFLEENKDKLSMKNN